MLRPSRLFSLRQRLLTLGFPLDQLPNNFKSLLEENENHNQQTLDQFEQFITIYERLTQNALTEQLQQEIESYTSSQDNQQFKLQLLAIDQEIKNKNILNPHTEHKVVLDKTKTCDWETLLAFWLLPGMKFINPFTNEKIVSITYAEPYPGLGILLTPAFFRPPLSGLRIFHRSLLNTTPPTIPNSTDEKGPHLR